MISEHLSFQDLKPESNLKSFKCTNNDLNDFLLNEALDYQKELLAKTYLVVNEDNGDVIAYFSLLNDTIRLEETSKATANRINRKIPNSKRRKHYPALKIGRLERLIPAMQARDWENKF